MNWAVIGQGILHGRFSALKECLNQLGVGGRLNIVEATPYDFEEKLKALLKTEEQIRVESPFGEAVVPLFHRLGILMSSLRAADCVLHRADGWWPDSALFHAFNQLLSLHGKGLQLDAEVLIVGAGAAARTAVASVLRAGFKRINITNKFNDQAVLLVSELKKSYFGCQFEFVTDDRLVLLPGTNALVINTTPNVESNDLLQELCYLNFMRRDGMIWDLAFSATDTSLIKEAEEIGVRCVRGLEIAAMVDQKWIEWTTGKQVDSSSLKGLYERSLAT